MKADRESVIKLIDEEYEKAKALPYIRKPMAYAVHQAWKVIDQIEKERKSNEEKS
jgi:hypothetical protein